MRKSLITRAAIVADAGGHLYITNIKAVTRRDNPGYFMINQNIHQIARSLREQAKTGKHFSKELGLNPASALVDCTNLLAVLDALPKCTHPRSLFKQSASGNESWHECPDCGEEV